MTFSPKKRALLLIDLSVEQFKAIIYQRDALLSNVANLLTLPWSLVIDSRLWLTGPEDSTLTMVFPEWGTSMGIPNTEGADLCPEFRSKDKGPGNLVFIPKKHYSSFVDANVQDVLQANKIEEVYIAGIQTDFCVFITAMDAFMRARVKTYVISDATSSAQGKGGHEEGLQRLITHLGASSVVSTEDVLGLFTKP